MVEFRPLPALLGAVAIVKIYAVRTSKGLQPLTDEDRAALIRIPEGDVLTLNHRGRRNGKLFRKFHALVNLIAEATDRQPNAVRLELKIRAGHYDEHITQHGEIVFVPKSIAYDECEPDEFAAFYAKVIEIAGRDMGIDVEGEGFA